MASLFTYETGPIRLCSPWPERKTEGSSPYPTAGGYDSNSQHDSAAPDSTPSFNVDSLAEYGVSKLEAEPQEGPVEYKLHLMLRQRQKFSMIFTVQKVSGSHLSSASSTTSASAVLSSESRTASNSHSRTDSTAPTSWPHAAPSPTTGTVSLSNGPSNSYRQNRLHHLTTQLLWRLQQSCPHHTSSHSDLVLPTLPESDIQKSLERGPQALVGGIEETLGALYEIGVSDDGSFVGLIQEELDESLSILRAMAYSLGCQIEVLRVVSVGNCSWEEKVAGEQRIETVRRTERLSVAEVLVSPKRAASSSFQSVKSLAAGDSVTPLQASAAQTITNASGALPRQLRVSLTGSTTSGKSSLLGTLSTSTLDNGRGKSRLSLFKHRHEIVSGITSSIAQELIGYRDQTVSNSILEPAERIVNYASPHVSSWEDIHHSVISGRLVFLTDSAGHPRYRRTTVRGLMSWAPDWTLCCVAAEEQDDGMRPPAGAITPGGGPSKSPQHHFDLSNAHLELCLKLKLPLVVLITKVDVASKQGLRQTCSKVLSLLKAAGRKPIIIPNTPIQPSGASLPSNGWSPEDESVVRKTIESCPASEAHALVPIILTSAISGVGIAKVHCLLRYLPMTTHDLRQTLGERERKENAVNDRPLFHVDEVFSLSKSSAASAKDAKGVVSQTDCVLSGYLKYGSLDVGQTVWIGPVGCDATRAEPEAKVAGENHRIDGNLSGLDPAYLQSISSSLKTSTLNDESQGSLQPIVTGGNVDLRECEPQQEESRAVSNPNHSSWGRVVITSIRYLRLPVRSLHAGQVASIGISFPLESSNFIPKGSLPTLSPQHSPSTAFSAHHSTSTSTPRRGMVLLGSPLPVFHVHTLSHSSDVSLPPSSQEPPPAYSTFAATFAEPNTYVIPGSSVTIYTASIRALAKIVTVRVAESETDCSLDDRGNDETSTTSASLSDDLAERDEDKEDAIESLDPSRQKHKQNPLQSSIASLTSLETNDSLNTTVPEAIEITFRFLGEGGAAREFLEMGTTVLVTPASGLSMISPGIETPITAGTASTNGRHETGTYSAGLHIGAQSTNLVASPPVGVAAALNLSTPPPSYMSGRLLDGFVGRIVRGFVE